MCRFRDKQKKTPAVTYKSENWTPALDPQPSLRRGCLVELLCVSSRTSQRFLLDGNDNKSLESCIREHSRCSLTHSATHFFAHFMKSPLQLQSSTEALEYMNVSKIVFETLPLQSYTLLHSCKNDRRLYDSLRIEFCE